MHTGGFTDSNRDTLKSKVRTLDIGRLPDRWSNKQTHKLADKQLDSRAESLLREMSKQTY